VFVAILLKKEKKPLEFTARKVILTSEYLIAVDTIHVTGEEAQALLIPREEIEAVLYVDEE
jgi:hypothetical protein